MSFIDIIATGKALPKNVVYAEDIDKMCGFEKGYTAKITGLEKRHFLKEQTSSELMKEAIDNALKNADMHIDDIDCIIAAFGTSQQAIPYNGAWVHSILNPKRNIPTFDVNMTCLSALRAFDIASKLFESYPVIMIVTCDIASVGLDWSDIRTAGIFGDGASAMIVKKSKTGGIIVSNFETYSEGFEYARIRAGGTLYPISKYKEQYEKFTKFEMNGKQIYKLSANILPDFVKRTLKKAGLSIEDIDYIVPHQASQSSLNHMIKILKLDKSKIIDIFKNHGNQVASSIPIALHELLSQNKLKSGDKVMIIGTSAGVGLGLVVWEVP
ncbi:3-oxoacyl-[acyl-carrier-protein] synthase III C-terminal domain-containing protein [Caminibacter pacificus]